MLYVGCMMFFSIALSEVLMWRKCKKQDMLFQLGSGSHLDVITK